MTKPTFQLRQETSAHIQSYIEGYLETPHLVNQANAGDGAAITEESLITLEGNSPSTEVLLFEMVNYRWRQL